MRVPLLTAALLLALTACAADDTTEELTPADDPTEQETADEEPLIPQDPPEGDPDDGVFEYTATEVVTVDSYSDEACDEDYDASGEFQVVGLRAENIGEDPAVPASAPEHEIHAYTEDGAQLAQHEEICTGVDEIDPGTSTEYEVVFDVPEGTELVALELTGEDAPGTAVVETP